MTSRLWEVWSRVLVDTVKGPPRWVLRVPTKDAACGLWSLLHTVLGIAGVTFEAVLSNTRAKPVLAARRAFVIAARRDPTRKYSYPDIAAALCRKHHSTAIYLHRRGWSDPLVTKILSRIPSPWGTAVEVR